MLSVFYVTNTHKHMGANKHTSHYTPYFVLIINYPMPLCLVMPTDDQTTRIYSQYSHCTRIDTHDARTHTNTRVRCSLTPCCVYPTRWGNNRDNNNNNNKKVELNTQHQMVGHGVCMTMLVMTAHLSKGWPTKRCAKPTTLTCDAKMLMSRVGIILTVVKRKGRRPTTTSKQRSTVKKISSYLSGLNELCEPLPLHPILVLYGI